MEERCSCPDIHNCGVPGCGNALRIPVLDRCAHCGHYRMMHNKMGRGGCEAIHHAGKLAGQPCNCDEMVNP